jgi:hypothetical protein
VAGEGRIMVGARPVVGGVGEDDGGLVQPTSTGRTIRIKLVRNMVTPIESLYEALYEHYKRPIRPIM